VDVILSTGMSTLGEVETALACLAFGFIAPNDSPSLDAFLSAYISPEGQDSLRKRVTLLHCTTEYPAPFGEVNLRSMRTLRDAFNLPVGYSDHTEGIAVSIAAAALGASVIEKHFTLDRSLPGPDHKASLEPRELAELVLSVCQIEAALGDRVKAPSPSERENRKVVRKSIVAKQKITTNAIITAELMESKRPGDGRSPMEYWNLLGKPSPSDFEAGDVL
jgi:N-acetylneuraminate synthase